MTEHRARPTFVPTSRGTFATLQRGHDDAPLALCLHGFPDAAGTFDALLDALALAGFRGVAPWMRGYAPSVLAGPYDPGSLASDVVALADALSPRSPVFVVGHDWGAVATYGALAARPDRFVRAVTMAVPHPTAFARNLARTPQQLRRSWYMGALQLPFASYFVARHNGAFLERLWRDWSPGFTPPRSHLDAVKQSILDGLPGPIEYYRAAARPLRAALARAREAASPEHRIRVPTLLLMGQDDGCIGPDLGRGQERHFAADFHQQTIEGAGHFLHLEQPDEIARRIVSFLSQV